MKGLFKAIILSALIVTSAKADVIPNTLFSNNGVLQRGVIVPVWGKARDGEKIEIDFAGQHVRTIAKDGKWMVKLSPLKAGGPYTMTIKGDNTVTLNNILIGEVWLCSGQSNMEFWIGKLAPKNIAETLKDAQQYPQIRQYLVPEHFYTAIPDPVDDAGGAWAVSDSTSAKKFSAVAFFFAKALYQRLKVPIGLINSSYGGTPIENWTSPKTLDSVPGLKEVMVKYENALKTYPERLKYFDDHKIELKKQYSIDSQATVKAKTWLPTPPIRPAHPADRGGPGGLYNAMIAPLIPYAVKGVLWYQGEANAGHGVLYRRMFPAMINNWRTAWQRPNLPFYFVQLPGWKELDPVLREAQLLTWQHTPNTGMAVITDLDDTVSVHPLNKQPVGQRLCLIARALTYHDKIEYSGPVYKSMRLQGNKVILSFTHANGLKAKGGELKDFIIAGNDKRFVSAKAEIKGDEVVVYSSQVIRPTAVRMGWRNCPQVNLYNRDGLPATAFRTDFTP